MAFESCSCNSLGLVIGLHVRLEGVGRKGLLRVSLSPGHTATFPDRLYAALGSIHANQHFLKLSGESGDGTGTD